MFGQLVPCPLHAFWPEHAFFALRQPLCPLQSFLPAQQFFSEPSRGHGRPDFGSFLQSSSTRASSHRARIGGWAVPGGLFGAPMTRGGAAVLGSGVASTGAAGGRGGAWRHASAPSTAQATRTDDDDFMETT